MSEHNDKSKTEVFDAFTEEKPIVRRAENDAYSRARSSAYEEDYYDNEEAKEKRGLTAIIIVITVLLIAVIVLGVYFLKGNESITEEIPLEKTEETETETVEEVEEPEEEEEEVVKPDVVSYKVAFQQGTVEEEGGKYTVRVNLYDSSMNKTETRRIEIDENTEIREGNEKMSLNSFVYILKSLGSEAFVCDARIDEKNGVLVSVSYSKKAVEKVEEEKEEEKEETSSEEKTEEESSENTQPEEDIPAEEAPSEETAPPEESATEEVPQQ